MVRMLNMLVIIIGVMFLGLGLYNQDLLIEGLEAMNSIKAGMEYIIIIPMLYTSFKAILKVRK